MKIFNSHWREGKSSVLKTIPGYSFMALVAAVCSGQHGVLSIFPIKDPSSPHSAQSVLASHAQKRPWCPFASSLTYIFLIKRKGGKYLFRLSEPNRNSRTTLGPEEGMTFLEEEGQQSNNGNHGSNSNKNKGFNALKCHPAVISLRPHQGPIATAGGAAPSYERKGE